MFQIQRPRRKNRERPSLPPGTSRFAALALGAGLLIDPGAAWAAQAAVSQMRADFPVSQLFTLLFLMLGPVKIIHPFLTVTHGADAALTRRIAVWSTLFASVALLLAAFLGEAILSRYGIPLPVMALAGGIILFLVALQSVLAQFAPLGDRGEASTGVTPKSPMKLAMSPIAFPTIVTPYGIAALVVFLAVSPDLESQLIVGAVLLLIMLLNLVTMLVAARLLPVLAIALPILGAVFGVIQVAVGLQIIHNALGTLGVL